jgi:hypothetical protein
MSRFQPQLVTSLSAVVNSVTSITLNWTNGENNGCQIERTVGLPAGNPPGNQFQPLATVSSGVTSYTDTTATAGMMFQYRVTTLPAGDTPMFVPAKGVTVSATTPGIQNHVYLQTPRIDPVGVMGWIGHREITDGSWGSL